MIRVFLVDDHELFLSGVRAELGERFEIAGWAADVDAAIEQIPVAAPDVVGSPCAGPTAGANSLGIGTDRGGSAPTDDRSDRGLGLRFDVGVITVVVSVGSTGDVGIAIASTSIGS